MGLTTATETPKLTESEFFILNRLVATNDWLKLTRTAPYLMTRLASLGYIELDASKTHARITETGKAIHREIRILASSGEPIACLVEEIRHYRYFRP